MGHPSRQRSVKESIALIMMLSAGIVATTHLPACDYDAASIAEVRNNTITALQHAGFTVTIGTMESYARHRTLHPRPRQIPREIAPNNT